MNLGRGRMALACAGVLVWSACGGKGIYRDTFTDEYDRENAEWEATQKRCQRGDQDACAEVGEAMFLGGKAPDHELRGLEMMQRSCDAGSWRGCLKLADVLARGDTGSQDLDRAVSTYQRTCQLMRKDDQCLSAASALLARGGAPEAHGKTMLTALCGPGHAMACSQLGMAYLAEGKTWRVQIRRRCSMAAHASSRPCSAAIWRSSWPCSGCPRRARCSPAAARGATPPAVTS